MSAYQEFESKMERPLELNYEVNNLIEYIFWIL
jgi:hypothetical protein